MPLYTTVGTVVVQRDNGPVSPPSGFQFNYTEDEVAYFLPNGSIRVPLPGDPLINASGVTSLTAYLLQPFASYKAGTVLVGSLFAAIRGGLNDHNSVVIPSGRGYPDATTTRLRARAAGSFTGTVRYSAVSNANTADYVSGIYNVTLTVESNYDAVKLFFFNDSRAAYDVTATASPSAVANTPQSFGGAAIAPSTFNAGDVGQNNTLAQEMQGVPAATQTLTVEAATTVLDGLGSLAATDWLTIPSEPATDRDQSYLLLSITTSANAPGAPKVPDLAAIGRAAMTKSPLAGYRVQRSVRGHTLMLVGDEIGFAGTADGVTGWAMRAAYAVSRPTQPLDYLSCCYQNVPFATLMMNAVSMVQAFRPEIVLIPLWSNNDPVDYGTAQTNIAKAKALGAMMREVGGVPIYYVPSPRVLLCYNAALDQVRMSAWAAGMLLGRNGEYVLDLNAILGDGQLPANYKAQFYLDNKNPNPAGHVAIASALIPILSFIVNGS